VNRITLHKNFFSSLILHSLAQIIWESVVMKTNLTNPEKYINSNHVSWWCIYIYSCFYLPRIFSFILFLLLFIDYSPVVYLSTSFCSTHEAPITSGCSVRVYICTSFSFRCSKKMLTCIYIILLDGVKQIFKNRDFTWVIDIIFAILHARGMADVGQNSIILTIGLKKLTNRKSCLCFRIDFCPKFNLI
jgi:hypothetical protein